MKGYEMFVGSLIGRDHLLQEVSLESFEIFVGSAKKGSYRIFTINMVDGYE